MPKKAVAPTKLDEPDPQILDVMKCLIRSVVQDYKGFLRRRMDVRELRPRVRKRVAMVRNNPLYMLPKHLADAYFDLAVKDLKKCGKLVVIPIMSRPGARRFIKKKLCFSSEPWVTGYVYEWCDSLLDALALVAS